MIETPVDKAKPLSATHGVNALLYNAQESIRHRFHECEQRVRQSPTKAVFAAVATGYCMHRLPVRAILVAQVRLLTALVPPALFVFGAAKAYEFLQRQEAIRRP